MLATREDARQICAAPQQTFPFRGGKETASLGLFLETKKFISLVSEFAGLLVSQSL